MRQTPSRCPVCDGCGHVRVGFYPDAPAETKCRACSGNGVLWGLDFAPTFSPVYPPVIQPGYRCSNCGSWIFPGSGNAHYCYYVPTVIWGGNATWNSSDITVAYGPPRFDTPPDDAPSPALLPR